MKAFPREDLTNDRASFARSPRRIPERDTIVHANHLSLLHTWEGTAATTTDLAEATRATTLVPPVTTTHAAHFHCPSKQRREFLIAVLEAALNEVDEAT